MGFIKYDIARNNDPIGMKIEPSIPLVVRGVAKKDTGMNGAIVYGELWKTCLGSKHVQKHEDVYKMGEYRKEQKTV